MALPGQPLDLDAPVVVTWHPDGSYDWLCRGCGKRHDERYPPHRGPRRRLCRSCQNVRAYRRRHPVAPRRGWQSTRYERWQLNCWDLRDGRA